MTRFRSAVVVLILVGSAIGIYTLGVRLNYERYSGDVREELMYFPSGRLLEVASVGFQMVASDLLWLKGIQYYGEHRRSDREYPLAEHIFSTITDLDPNFVGAYRFGAFVLAQDVGQPAAGLELLRKGMRNNPQHWQLPFDLGFLYFNSIRDNAKAAHFFRYASRFDDSPEIARRFSAFAYRRAGREDVALSLWDEIYRSSSNEVMRETAQYAIYNIRTDQVADALTELAERFTGETGRPPSRLEELVRAGYAQGIPDDPFGGTFFFDPVTRRVYSTTKVTRQARNLEKDLSKMLTRYRHMRDRLPETLSGLVREGLIEEVPSVPGAELRYDREDGTVGYAFPWGDRQ